MYLFYNVVFHFRVKFSALVKWLLVVSPTKSGLTPKEKRCRMAGGTEVYWPEHPRVYFRETITHSWNETGATYSKTKSWYFNNAVNRDGMP